MREEYNSCPECGGVALPAYNYKAKAHVIYCTNCDNKTRMMKTKEEAEEAWCTEWDNQWKSYSTKMIYKC